MSVHDDPEPIDLGADPAPATPASSGRSWAIAGGAAVAMVAIGVAAMGLLGGDESATEADTTSSSVAVDDVSGDTADDTRGGPGFGGGVFGTLTEIEGASFIVDVTDRSGDSTTTRVVVTDETIFTETQDGTLDGVQVGDHVLVTGETADDGTVSAASLADNNNRELTFGGGNGGGPPDGFEPPEGFDPPEGFEPPADGAVPDDFQPPEGGLPGGGPGGGGPGGLGGVTVGEVTSVDGSTIVIQPTDGQPVTVTVSGETTITETVEVSIAALEVGDTVQVTGDADGDRVVAETVQVGATRGFGAAGGPGAGGTPPTSAEGD